MTLTSRTFEVRWQGVTTRVDASDDTDLKLALIKLGVDVALADASARAAWVFSTVTEDGLKILEVMS